MAAIDKCYVDNYTDYQQFKEWAKNKKFTTPRGVEVKISNWIFDWEEEDFKSGCVPIFNTPIYIDNYLYHNCPLKFIQDWLSDRYPEESGYSKGEPDDIRSELKIPDYEPCTRVKIVKKGIGKKPYRLYNSYSNKKKGFWWIDVRSSDNCGLWYNEDYDYWLLPDEHDKWTSSYCTSPLSVRTIIRKILKVWKLPKNCTVEIFGKLVGDTWILKTY